MAVSKYDKENLSKKDQDRIAAVTAAAERGEMSWADAHNEAESIRNNAGYSGGRYGNEYNSKDSGSSSGSYGGSYGGSNQNNGLHFNGIEYTQTGGGIYGIPTINSDVKNYTQGGVTYQVGANMARRPDLAGKIAISNGYTVFYDENGYATKAIKGVADYTPHQDINAGNGTYNSSGAWTDNEMLTEADRKKIESIRAQMQAGKLSGDEANYLANQIRSGYGYTIDKQGNVTDLLAKSKVDARRQKWGLDTYSPSDAQQNFLNLWNDGVIGGQNIDMDSVLSMLGQGNFGIGGYAPEWQGSQWDDLLNQVANELASMNYEDWTKGDQYKALAERYGNEGRMSMQDVIGQISSRTGGLASSYATTAAQQKYNQFMSELEAAAMEMYGVERSDLLDKANMYRQLGQDDYDKYLDELGQWNTDRNFQYGVYRDNISDQRYDTEWDYQVGRDQIADQRYEDETEYNQALAKAQTLAAAGDFSGYKALGYTDQEIAGLKSAYNKAQASAREDVYAGMYKAGIRSEGDAYAWLLSAGYNTTQAGKLAGYFSEWLESKENGGADEDYTIVNRHGYDADGTVGWIYIPGHGRFSVQEVYNYVESGKVKETIGNDGTIRYTWVNEK